MRYSGHVSLSSTDPSATDLTPTRSQTEHPQCLNADLGLLWERWRPHRDVIEGAL